MEDLTRLFAEGHSTIFTAKTPNLEIVRDNPDDNKFLECAVALGSKIIISGDKPLKELKKYIDIEILAPREFLELYNRNNFL